MPHPLPASGWEEGSHSRGTVGAPRSRWEDSAGPHLQMTGTKHSSRKRGWSLGWPATTFDNRFQEWRGRFWAVPKCPINFWTLVVSRWSLQGEKWLVQRNSRVFLWVHGCQPTRGGGRPLSAACRPAGWRRTGTATPGEGFKESWSLWKSNGVGAVWEAAMEEFCIHRWGLERGPGRTEVGKEVRGVEWGVPIRGCSRQLRVFVSAEDRKMTWWPVSVCDHRESHWGFKPPASGGFRFARLSHGPEAGQGQAFLQHLSNQLRLMYPPNLLLLWQLLNTQ